MNDELYYSNDLEGFNHYIAKTMGKMALGLFVSTVVAVFLIFSGAWMLFFTSRFTTLILALCQLGVAFYLQGKIDSISPNKALFLFLAYSALSGVTFSILPFLFDVWTMFIAFGLTTLMFGSMAVIGKTTSVDLTKYSTYFSVALIMLIVTVVLGIFFNLGVFQTVVNYLAILLFLGLTAYDVQMLKKYYDYYNYDSGMLSKMCTIGALQLYLDFVNIFLYVLRILGKNRD